MLCDKTDSRISDDSSHCGKQQQFLEDVLLPKIHEKLDRQTQIIVAMVQERMAHVLQQSLRSQHARRVHSSEQATPSGVGHVPATLSDFSSRHMAASVEEIDPFCELRHSTDFTIKDQKQHTDHASTGRSLQSAPKSQHFMPKYVVKNIGRTLGVSDAYQERGSSIDSSSYSWRKSLHGVVHSKSFRIIVSLAILANSILISMETEDLLSSALKGGDDSETLSRWTIAEIVFSASFALELILRACADGMLFFKGQAGFWNVFDLVLVVEAVLSILSEFILTRVTESNTGAAPNLTFVRTLRILRFFRVLRFMRVTRYFTNFRVMMVSFLNSLRSLLWAVLMLFFTIYFFSIVISHGIILDVGANSEKRLLEHYGTIPKTLLSLFMAITGGMDWKELYTPLAALNSYSAAVFVVYICFAVFGVLNTVTSMFVDSIQKASLSDRQHVVQLELERHESYVRACRKFFWSADKNKTGTLTWEELNQYLQVEKNRAHLATLELDETQAKALYIFADIHKENCIEIENFVMACEQLKGAAKAVDVFMLHYESQKAMSHWERLMKHLHYKLESIQAKLDIPHVRPHDGLSEGSSQHSAQLSFQERMRKRHSMTYL